MSQMRLQTELPIPPRPESHTDDIYDRAATKLLPMVTAWIGQGQLPEAESERLARDLREIVECSYKNGYQLSRDFERLGYDPDDDLVGIFGQVLDIIYDAWMDAVRKWVTDHDIKPKHKVGDHVIATNHKGETRGVVAHIYEKEARYLIGDRNTWKAGERIGRIFDYEQVSLDAEAIA